MRTRPPDRFPALIDAATRLFVRAGVRRVQMDEVARALGVAKGTLYGTVASKEALFDACLRLADTQPVEPDVLPIPTPSADATLAFVREVAREASAFPTLTAALGAPEPDDTTHVLADLYDGLSHNGTRLRLVAGSAVDWPELGAIWFREARNPLVARLADWIADRSERRWFRPGLHPQATARHVAETITWFAVHRKWDPFPNELTDAVARSTALSALNHTLLPDA